MRCSSAAAASASTPCSTIPKSCRNLPGSSVRRRGLYVPLSTRNGSIGIAFAHDRDGRDARFTSADLRLAEHFVQRAAVAVELSRRVKRDSLRRMIEGQEGERRRLARELHVTAAHLNVGKFARDPHWYVAVGGSGFSSTNITNLATRTPVIGYVDALSNEVIEFTPTSSGSNTIAFDEQNYLAYLPVNGVAGPQLPAGDFTGNGVKLCGNGIVGG